MTARLAILGAGSWGTALAVVLAPRSHQVRLWMRDAQRAEAVRRLRENRQYLPGVRLPENVEPVADLRLAVAEADVVLVVVPSQSLRELAACLKGVMSRPVPIISAIKGLEERSRFRMSQVLQQTLGGDFPVAVLSGPAFARELAAREPAAMVIASEDAQLASRLQEALSSPTLRLYRSRDVAGVELGGALKNVIAIGAGICHGLELGSNALAALITRGLAEITRLATALGAQARTLSGLAGLGDLVLTCTGPLSRNRQLGIELARGRSLEEALASTHMVSEGVATTRVAVELADALGVELPISRQMYAVLYEGKPPRAALGELMERTLKEE